MKDWKFNLTMIITLLAVGSLFVGIQLAISEHDKLTEWRENPGFQEYMVTFDGRHYYCDHVEVPAGMPEKLYLYRGDDYLVLPDKYVVKTIKKLPNSGGDNGN